MELADNDIKQVITLVQLLWKTAWQFLKWLNRVTI